MQRHPRPTKFQHETGNSPATSAELAELARLHGDGTLSRDEYQAACAQVLARQPVPEESAPSRETSTVGREEGRPAIDRLPDDEAHSASPPLWAKVVVGTVSVAVMGGAVAWATGWREPDVAASVAPASPSSEHAFEWATVGATAAMVDLESPPTGTALAAVLRTPAVAIAPGPVPAAPRSQRATAAQMFKGKHGIASGKADDAALAQALAQELDEVALHSFRNVVRIEFDGRYLGAAKNRTYGEVTAAVTCDGATKKVLADDDVVAGRNWASALAKGLAKRVLVGSCLRR